MFVYVRTCECCFMSYAGGSSQSLSSKTKTDPSKESSEGSNKHIAHPATPPRGKKKEIRFVSGLIWSTLILSVPSSLHPVFFSLLLSSVAALVLPDLLWCLFFSLMSVEQVKVSCTIVFSNTVFIKHNDEQFLLKQLPCHLPPDLFGTNQY